MAWRKTRGATQRHFLVLLAWVLLSAAHARAARERPWCQGGSALCSGSATAQASYEAQSLLATNGLIYMYGGRTGRLPSEVYDSKSYQELNVKGMALRSQLLTGWESVPGRSGHTMVEWSDAAGRRKLVVFGGASYQASESDYDTVTDDEAVPDVLLGDVAAIDLQSSTWEPHNDTGSGPSPRRYSSAVVWRGDMMLVFGGETADGSITSELWAYNLTSRKWIGQVAVQDTTPSPPPALRSAALTVYGDFLILYGGYRTSTYLAMAPSPPPSPMQGPGGGAGGGGGPTGAPGEAGPSGPSGASGPPGAGPTGPSGPSGPSGSVPSGPSSAQPPSGAGGSSSPPGGGGGGGGSPASASPPSGGGGGGTPAPSPASGGGGGTPPSSNPAGAGGGGAPAPSPPMGGGGNPAGPPAGGSGSTPGTPPAGGGGGGASPAPPSGLAAPPPSPPLTPSPPGPPSAQAPASPPPMQPPPASPPLSPPPHRPPPPLQPPTPRAPTPLAPPMPAKPAAGGGAGRRLQGNAPLPDPYRRDGLFVDGGAEDGLGLQQGQGGGRSDGGSARRRLQEDEEDVGISPPSYPDPPSPPRPPTMVTLLDFSLSKGLYLVDLRAFPSSAAWVKAELTVGDGQPAAVHMAGFDTTISSVASEDGGVAIYTSGGVTSSGVAVQSLWRQWYAKYRISNVSTAIDQLATSPNLIATTRVALNITRQGLFRHPDIQITSSSGSPSAPSSSPTLSPSSTSSTTWVNVDETAVDLASGPAVAQLPDSFSPRWVRSQSWVTISGADEAMFLTGGYYQADEGYDVTATSRQLVLEWGTGGTQSLDDTIKHDYFETSSSSVVMRSMHKVALPGQDTGQSQTINTNTNSSSSSSSPSLTSTVGTITGLIFFGKYDTSAVDQPELSTAVVSDIATFSQEASCGSTPESSCIAAFAGDVSGPPPKRNGYASAPLFASYSGEVYGGKGPFTVRAPLVLLYGGVATVGGPPPTRVFGGASGSSSLKAALVQCDTRRLVSDTDWTSYATCAWNKMYGGSTGSSSGGSSTTGGTGATSGGTGAGTGGTEATSQQQQPTGRRRRDLLASSGATGSSMVVRQGPGDEYGSDCGAGDYPGDFQEGQGWGSGGEGWGLRDGRVVGVGGQGPARRRLTGGGGKGTQYAPETRVYFDEALVMVYQRKGSSSLTQRAAGSAASVHFDTPLNLLGGGVNHSPGPRVGATASAVSVREVLLYGGETYDRSKYPTGADVPSSDLVVCGDVHYMRYYVGGEEVEAAPARASACPNAAAGGDAGACAPRTPFPLDTSGQELPATAPLLSPTQPDLPTAHTTFSCPSGREVRIEVLTSRSLEDGAKMGLRLATWAGDVVAEVTSLGGTAPGQTMTTTATLPTGLLQVWLTASDGRGWTRDPDTQGPPSRCCSATTSACCPQLRLFSTACNAYLTGFGPGEVTFDVGTANRKDPSYYVYRKVLALLVQPTTDVLPPDAPTASPNIQFPLQQRGSYLHSFELQPAAASPVPPARTRHAAVFIDTEYLYDTYGPNGFLLVYGGSTTRTVSVGSARLSDLWAFCLHNNSWVQLTPTGTAPPALIDHALAVVDTQVFLGGGEYYNPTTSTFQQDTSVYMLDLGLSTLIWRRLSGGSTLFNTTSPTTGSYAMEYIPDLAQLAFSTPTDLLLIPITTRRSFTSSGLTSSTDTQGGREVDAAGSSSSSSSSTAVIDTRLLTPLLSSLFDGDTVLLGDVATVQVLDGQPLLITAAIFLQGRYLGSNSASQKGSNNSSSSSGQQQGRRLHQHQHKHRQQQHGSEESAGAQGLPRGEDSAVFRVTVGDRGRVGLVRQQEPGAGAGDTATAGVQAAAASVSSQDRGLSTLDPPGGASSTSTTVQEALSSNNYHGISISNGGAAAMARRLQQEASGAPPPPPPPVNGWVNGSSSPTQPPDAEQILQSYVDRFRLTVVECNGTYRGMTVQVGGVVVQNLLIRNCRDTAVLVDTGGSQSTVRFANCVFYNNTGTYGGAMRVASGSVVTIEDSLFLGNEAQYGGALYVESGGTVSSLDAVDFVLNGNSAGSSLRGGALHVSSGGCIASLTDCLFDSNGNANATSGGAVFLQLPSCSFAAASASFQANAAAWGGGLHVSGLDSGMTVTLTGCKFVGNKAASQGGGALLVEQSYGRVALALTEFDRNVAQRRGGGLMTTSTRFVDVANCSLSGNVAVLGQGGGWYAEREGTITVTGSRLVGNTAMQGGGLSLHRDLVLTVSDTTLEGNAAGQSAGALEAQECSQLNVDRCSFLGNSAGAGGAVHLRYTAGAATFASTVFEGNAAAANTVAAEPCSSYGGGGGGAACVEVAGEVLFVSCSFRNNSATNGGAIWASQKCDPLNDDTCGYVRVYGSAMYGNAAVGGGGGAVFLYEAEDVVVSCDANGTAPYGALSLPAVNCGEAVDTAWASNEGLYGSVVATTAVSLRVMAPANSTATNYRSNDQLVTTVEVLDAFGQRISGGSLESATTLNAVGVSTQPLGVTSQSATAGVANFTSMRVRERPGPYVFNISAYGTYHVLSQAVVQVEVRQCYVGEVTNAEGDLCTTCAAESFSFEPSNTTCDTCPSNARCGDGGRGYLVLQEDGYWRSGPYSPQVLLCPNADACTYDGDSSVAAAVAASGAPRNVSRQEALGGALAVINAGGGYNDTEEALQLFLGLQCSDGYYGNLCAGCLPGYGQTGEATCSKCPPKSLNSLYYVLVSLINVVMIMITIRAQLVRSEGDSGSQSKTARELREGERSGRVDSPGSGKPHGLLQRLSLWRHTAKKEEEKKLPNASMDESGGGERVDSAMMGAPAARARALASASKVAVRPESSSSKRNQQEEQQQQQQRQEGKQGRGAGGSKEGLEDGDDNEAVGDAELNQGTHSIVIKILVSYLQVASIVKDVALVWPSPVAWLLSLGDQVSSGATTMVSLDCSLPENAIPKSIQKLIMSVAMPWILLALSVPCWYGIYAVQQYRQRRRAAKAARLGIQARPQPPLPPHAQYLRPRLIVTAISIIFFTYPDVTDALLGIFACPLLDDKAGGGAPYQHALRAAGRFWSSDYTMACYGGVHRVLLLALGVPGVLLFSCGVPAFSAWFLWRHVAELRNRSFYRAYGFLYSDYEERCFYWESVVMLRKLAMVVVVVFLGPIGTGVQLMVCLGVVMAALVAQIYADPYRSPRMDTLERLSLCGTIVLIYVALYFMLDVGDTAGLVLTLCLLVLNGAILAAFAAVLVREYLAGAMAGWDADGDGVLTAQDVAMALEDLSSRKPAIARRMLAVDAALRASPRIASLLSYCYPYGEPNDPWVIRALQRAEEARLREQHALAAHGAATAAAFFSAATAAKSIKDYGDRGAGAAAASGRASRAKELAGSGSSGLFGRGGSRIAPEPLPSAMTVGVPPCGPYGTSPMGTRLGSQLLQSPSDPHSDLAGLDALAAAVADGADAAASPLAASGRRPSAWDSSASGPPSGTMAVAAAATPQTFSPMRPRALGASQQQQHGSGSGVANGMYALPATAAAAGAHVRRSGSSGGNSGQRQEQVRRPSDLLAEGDSSPIGQSTQQQEQQHKLSWRGSSGAGGEGELGNWTGEQAAASPILGAPLEDAVPDVDGAQVLGVLRDGSSGSVRSGGGGGGRALSRGQAGAVVGDGALGQVFGIAVHTANSLPGAGP